MKSISMIGLAVLVAAFSNTAFGQNSANSTPSMPCSERIWQANGNRSFEANDQLKDIASKNNIKLPADMNAENQATYDRLSKLTGVKFDRAYARDMVTDHQKDMAAFKRESELR